MELPNVLIAHAVNRPVFTKSCYQGMLQTLMNYPGRISVRIAEGLLPAWSRNYLIDQFLADEQAEYIFFVDSDTGIPPDALVKLVQAKKDIISGLYFGRVLPNNPIMKKTQKDEYGKERLLPILDYPEGVIEVEMIGAGCLLIHKDVFKKLQRPYFFSPSLDFTEDAYFCQQARERNYKIFVDTTVKCLHDTTISVSEADFIKNRL